MTFKTEVIGCYWQQETGEWLVKLKQTQADGSTRLFEDRCHLLLHGTGILNNFKWPKIEGMEKFKGKVSDGEAYVALIDVIRLFILHAGRKTTRRNSGRTTEWRSSEVVPALSRRECDLSRICAKPHMQAWSHPLFANISIILGVHVVQSSRFVDSSFSKI